MRIGLGTSRLTSRLSLRLKLTLWMVVISCGLQGSVALVVLLYQGRTLNQNLEEKVRSRIDAVAEGLRKKDFTVSDEDLERITGDLTQFAPPGVRILATLYTHSGQVIATTLRPPIPMGQAELARARMGSGAVFVPTDQPQLSEQARRSSALKAAMKSFRAGDGRGYVLFIATTDASFARLSKFTREFAFVTLTVGMATAALASWFIAGLATQPLHELRRFAGSLSPEGIEEDMTIAPRSSHELTSLHKELEDVRSRLREALHAQDRFISSVSHELKTPIAVLLTEAQTLDSRLLQEEPRRFVQSVTEEMRRLGRMVESFLTLTKVRGGMKLVTPERVMVNDLVLEAAQSCSKMARQYGVTLSPELSTADPSPVVSGDSELLRVMVDNLIHNAIRFSRDGQRVMISVNGDDGACSILVRDFGPGVPDDMRDRLFEQFVQAPGESSRGIGHGLGLSIAQGIAELHGGKIAVQNFPDSGGCEFSVQLPLVGARAHAAPAPVQA